MSDYEKRGYLLENFRLFHLHSDRGISTDYHYHEFCKVLLLVSGSGSYYVEGQRYLIQSGDVVLIGSRSVHRPELDAAAPYERIIFYISPEYLERESTPDCNLQSIFSGEHGHVLRLKDAQRSAVFQLAASMEKDLQSNLFGREIVVGAGMLRLLVEIGRSMLAEDIQENIPLVNLFFSLKDNIAFLTFFLNILKSLAPSTNLVSDNLFIIL